ncbi:MAG: extracellular solute-binding protein [Gammaproteobacteria bacterium]
MRNFLVAFLTLFTLNAVADELVVYSGRGEALVAPLFAQFEKDTGIKLDVRYNTTSSLATQLLSEQQNSPADVVFFQESGYLTLLAEAGLLKELKPELLTPVSAQFQDEKKRWLGTSARVRVLAYNTNLVKPQDLPKDLKELTDPKWSGKIGWAPSNASMQAHVSALRVLWGEEPTFKWLEGVKNNKPLSFQKNAQTVSAVGQGDIAIGWVNHYYLYQLKKQNPNLPVANYNFPESGKAGNILIISGAGIHTHTKKQAQAEQFIAYLSGEKAQQYFANESFEYPTRTGIATNPEVTPLADIHFASVSQKDLAEVEPTLKMLRQLGLI